MEKWIFEHIKTLNTHAGHRAKGCEAIGGDRPLANTLGVRWL